MANTIGSSQANTAGFIPQVWLTTALQVVRANIVLAKLCTMDSDMSGGGFSQGNILNIPYPGTFTAQDKTAGNPVTVAQPANAGSVSLTLSKHKTVDFLIEDFAQAQADTALMEKYMQPAAIAIVEAVESDLLSLYQKFTSPSVGVVGTGLGDGTLRSARKNLNDAKIPMTDRFVIVSDSDEIALLGNANLQQYFAYTQTQAIAEGAIGRLYGFDIYPSQLVPTFVQASHAIQILADTGTVSGGTFTLTFSGQTTANIPWNATPNQVEAALAALSNVGLGNVRCAMVTHGSPQDTSLPQAAPAGMMVEFFTTTPAAMTVTNTNLTGSTPAVTVADYALSTPNQNIVAHKNAVLMAVRPFAPVPEGLGAIITQMQDPVSGLALRMTAQYDGNYKGVHGSLDILYGFTAMRPTFGLVAIS